MKPGDLIYRVMRTLDDKWYYCIYELVKCTCNTEKRVAKLLVTPIVTYYDARPGSCSMIIVNYNSLDIIDYWAHDWDYVTTDQYLARYVFLEMTRDENQSNNEDASNT